jgi:hypothetical protein
VLLALVDENNRFLALDVSAYGKGGVAGIFTNSVLGKSILSGTVEFPEARPLPGMTTVLQRDCRSQGI